MTIAAIWLEDGLQWCAADTRLVAGSNDQPTSEIAAKIYAIPVGVRALDPGHIPRQPHYSTQYGFVYAGATGPATMTESRRLHFFRRLPVQASARLLQRLSRSESLCVVSPTAS
jgi:hypothetical protein